MSISATSPRLLNASRDGDSHTSLGSCATAALLVLKIHLPKYPTSLLPWRGSARPSWPYISYQMHSCNLKAKLNLDPISRQHLLFEAKCHSWSTAHQEPSGSSQQLCVIPMNSDEPQATLHGSRDSQRWDRDNLVRIFPTWTCTFKMAPTGVRDWG